MIVVRHLTMVTSPSLSSELSQMKAWILILDHLVLSLLMLLPLLAVVVDPNFVMREVDQTFAVVGNCPEEEI